MSRLCVAVSSHGFGHASRTAAWLAALRAHAGPSLEVVVRTRAPARFFERADPAARIEPADVDVALVQPNGMDVDLDASLPVFERWLAEWDARADAEASALRRLGATLVAADVPALAFEAAHRAGVPAVGISNFSWDWILGGYAEAEPRWRPVVERFATAYAHADAVYRLPFRGGFESVPPDRVIDTPLIAPRGCGDLEAVRRAIGLAPDDPRPVALVSFGGFGSGGADLAHGDDLTDWLFVGFEAKPAGLRGEWRQLDTHGALPHPDLVAFCDVVVSKTAYGTAAEAMAAGTPFLFLTRPGFRESPVFERGLAALGAGRVFPREDFARGRWRIHLEAARAMRPPVRAADGAEQVARALWARLAEPGVTAAHGGPAPT